MICAKTVENITAKKNVRKFFFGKNGDCTSCHESADEAFPSLFGRYLDQRCFAKPAAKDECKYVIPNDKPRAQEKVDYAVINIEDHHGRLEGNEQERHMGPGELAELISVDPFLKRCDKKHES